MLSCLGQRAWVSNLSQFTLCYFRTVCLFHRALYLSTKFNFHWSDLLKHLLKDLFVNDEKKIRQFVYKCPSRLKYIGSWTFTEQQHQTTRPEFVSKMHAMCHIDSIDFNSSAIECRLHPIVSIFQPVDCRETRPSGKWRSSETFDAI